MTRGMCDTESESEACLLDLWMKLDGQSGPHITLLVRKLRVATKACTDRIGLEVGNKTLAAVPPSGRYRPGGAAARVDEDKAQCLPSRDRQCQDDAPFSLETDRYYVNPAEAFDAGHQVHASLLLASRRLS